MKENGLVDSWRNTLSSIGVIAFLLLLLAVDLVFVLLHFLLLFGVLDDSLLSLERDRGYPEIYQYIKISSVAILLFFVFARTKVFSYSVWSMLFLYLLLDDALSIHESLGGYIATNMLFAPAIGLRAQDFGELAVSAIAAALFLAPLALFYIRGSDASREVSKYLFSLLVALAFFGIFVDMLHVAMKVGWKVRFLLGVVEDGGEMLVMSIMTWYVFLLYGRIEVIGSSLQTTP
jgi:hypothetical protein